MPRPAVLYHDSDNHIAKPESDPLYKLLEREDERAAEAYLEEVLAETHRVKPKRSQDADH